MDRGSRPWTRVITRQRLASRRKVLLLLLALIREASRVLALRFQILTERILVDIHDSSIYLISTGIGNPPLRLTFPSLAIARRPPPTVATAAPRCNLDLGFP